MNKNVEQEIQLDRIERANKMVGVGLVMAIGGMALGYFMPNGAPEQPGNGAKLVPVNIMQDEGEVTLNMAEGMQISQCPEDYKDLSDCTTTQVGDPNAWSKTETAKWYAKNVFSQVGMIGGIGLMLAGGCLGA